MKVNLNCMPLQPLYDVVGKTPRPANPEEWLIPANHHDGWVNGAEDPLSGQSAMIEETRALGELVKQGWKPKRTIIYCAWDGEEPGLLGSTEWVETHADELDKHAVMYINSDGNGRGYFDLAGSHTLEKFINDVAKDVQDPETKLSAWKRDELRAIEAAPADKKQEVRQRADLHLGALGSGSDFTPFLQHVGIASLDMGFGGEDQGGIYHSIYDDFYWYTHFSDTSFVYGRALAQAAGTTVMRLADADVLPFVFTNLVQTAQRYETELEQLRDKRAEQIAARKRNVDEGMYAIVDDPRDPLKTPTVKETVPPHFNFAPLTNALEALKEASAQYEKAYTGWRDRSGVTQAGGSAALKDVNEDLLKTERQLLAADGLPKRPWFRHLLYAPGYYTGYGVKTMPGVREAIEQGDWTQVNGEISRVATALQNEAKVVADAAARLERAR